MYGISGTVLDWFQSYLTDRKQTVVINGTNSSLKEVKFGVPQGSVLGAGLYCDYSGPLGEIIRLLLALYHMFADDSQLAKSLNTKIMGEDRNAVTKIEQCVESISEWMSLNRLKLNEDKTEFIVLGSKHNINSLSTKSIKVGGNTIESVPIVRNLGFHMDSNLTFHDHISLVCKTAMFNIRKIYSIRNCLSEDATKTLVQSLVISRMDYCNVLYFGLPEGEIKRLQRVQNCAARLITKVRKYDSIKPTLFKLHWLPMAFRPIYKILLLTYKCLNGTGAGYLTTKLHYYKPERTLRSSEKMLLQEKRSKTKYGDRAFEIAAPKLWNKLPPTIRNCDTILRFKKELKTHLFKTAYQSLL